MDVENELYSVDSVDVPFLLEYIELFIVDPFAAIIYSDKILFKFLEYIGTFISF